MCVCVCDCVSVCVCVREREREKGAEKVDKEKSACSVIPSSATIRSIGEFLKKKFFLFNFLFYIILFKFYNVCLIISEIISCIIVKSRMLSSIATCQFFLQNIANLS